MAEKLERKVMEIYGENAATRDIIAYGSDIAGNIVETKDPDVIQTEAYKTGVRSAVVGNNSTTLQNRQALDFLFSRQLKYLYQHGIPEWGADETYYKSSVVKGSDGNIYGSKIDDNVGHNPVGDIANWEQLNGSGFDFEGTKAEFDAAVAAGTITADSVSLITDDVSGDNVATKAELQAVDISKADTSLSNTTPSQSFKEMSVGWGMPDYSSAITGNSVAGKFIQCPADAAVCVFGSDSYTEDFYAYVSPDNGTTKYIVGRRKDDANSNTQTTSFYFLVPKNWYFTTTVENGFTYQIYPLSGGQNA